MMSADKGGSWRDWALKKGRDSNAFVEMREAYIPRWRCVRAKPQR